MPKPTDPTAGNLSAWLEAKIGELRTEALTTAALCAVGGLVALAVTFVLVLAFVYVIGGAVGLPPDARFWTTWAVVAGLFALNAATDREKLHQVTVTDGDRVFYVWAPQFSFGGALPMSPDIARQAIRGWSDLILSGPRLTGEAIGGVRRASRLASIDRDGVSALLETLRTGPRRMPFDELLKKARPADPERTLREMAEFEGVVFLTDDPPGLALSPELRGELAEAAAGRS